MNERPQIYPLSSVTKGIENLINKHASKYFWVKAEIVKLNLYPHSGHAYPDLVEKKDGKILAELRGNIWRDDFTNINKRFKAVLHEELKDGMTVVCFARVKYHPVHGLSLNIIDINPEYTLGELARQREETIKRLKKEGIYHQNQLLSLPVLTKTIAVISVGTSKGYNDFISVIDKNPWGYAFHYKLFPALLQGERSVGSILAQLDRIREYQEIFDAVTIIRGGGGDIGLSSYDNYELAKAVASYPIPVLSGIGHSTNLTVTEMVSHQHFITPTKIAEFLIQKYHNFNVPLKENTEQIERYSEMLFETNRLRLGELSRLFRSLSENYLSNMGNRLDTLANRIGTLSQVSLENEKNRLQTVGTGLLYFTEILFMQERTSQDNLSRILNVYVQNRIEKEKNILISLDKQLQLLSPENTLKRGFSITRLNGKRIVSVGQVTPGLTIQTQLYDGTFESEIKQSDKNKLKK